MLDTKSSWGKCVCWGFEAASAPSRRSSKCRAPESHARSNVCGERTCSRVGESGTDLAEGIAIFEATWPVVGEKCLRRESVPAE